MARAGLKHQARRLGLQPSLTGLRFTRSLQLPVGPEGAATLRSLRFQQTVGGVRVVWSKLDVVVTERGVSSINATVVPVAPDRLRWGRRVSPGRALRIARGRVVRSAQALRPQLVAYAGRPTTSKARRRMPRLAYVVETLPASQRDQHIPTGVCVVIDAATGKVVATWKGSAAQPLPRREAGSRAAGAARRARSAAVNQSIMTVVDARGQIQYELGALYSSCLANGDPFNHANWPDQPFFHQSYRDSVAQPATGARAHKAWTSRCTGELQHWQVRARPRQGMRFRTGRRRVRAVATTQNASRVTDTRKWCERVQVSGAFR